MIRDAASPAARSATKTLSGARVGEGVALPGIPATGVAPRVRVPEREPPILHSVSTLISPLLPFSLGEIVAVREIRCVRLAGIGLVNQNRGTLAYGHVFHIMRGGIVHLVRDGNTQISGSFIIRHYYTCRSMRKHIPAQRCQCQDAENQTPDSCLSDAGYHWTLNVFFRYNNHLVSPIAYIMSSILILHGIADKVLHEKLPGASQRQFLCGTYKVQRVENPKDLFT